METVIWIFHNVMPWVGVYFVVVTVAFFILLTIDFLTLRARGNIDDFTDLVNDWSVIVNIIPVLWIRLISWLIERLRADKERKEET